MQITTAADNIFIFYFYFFFFSEKKRFNSLFKLSEMQTIHIKCQALFFFYKKKKKKKNEKWNKLSQNAVFCCGNQHYA